MSKQWSLEDCVARTLKALELATDEDRTFVLENPESVHHSLGRWIRNNCGLWEHGTDRCVEDIVREYKAGRLNSKYLDTNQFVHPGLPFDIMNTKKIPRQRGHTYTAEGKRKRSKPHLSFDHNLTHPDNCSAVIIEVVIERLRDGCS